MNFPYLVRLFTTYGKPDVILKYQTTCTDDGFTIFPFQHSHGYTNTLMQNRTYELYSSISLYLLVSLTMIALTLAVLDKVCMFINSS